MKSISRLFRLFRRHRSDQDLDNELRSYVESMAAEKVRAGMPSEVALRAARMELGGAAQVKELVRDAQAGAWMDVLAQDLRYGARMIRRNPGFALVATITLALGIGANTALFSVLNAVLLRALPYRDPGNIIYVSETWRDAIIHRVSAPNFLLWRSRGQTFSGIEGFGGGGDLNLTGSFEPERIQGVMVTAGFLDLLGIRPAIGRNFTREEDLPGGPPAVLLGQALWKRRFGESPEIVGKNIQLDGKAYAVAGVLPASFVFPDNEYRADLLLPMALPPNPGRQYRLLKVLARLKPGVSAAAMRAEFEALARGPSPFATSAPEVRKDVEVTVTPLREWLSGDVRRVLVILQVAVALVLLIGCLNVANLQLARSISRQKEITLRLTLGAGRGRLCRQLLTESILLSGLGGAAGLVVAYWCVNSLRPFLPAGLHLLQTIRLDPVELTFALGIALATGIFTGLAPAVAASRTNANQSLQEGGGRTTSGERHRRLRSALVIAEVALAMVLLAGSGLLIRTFMRLSGTDPGFNPRGVLTVRVALPRRGGRYATPERQTAFYSELLEKASAIPGVESAAVAQTLPLGGMPIFIGAFVEGRPQTPPETWPTVSITPVSPDYFRTLQIPLLRGRAFNASDRRGSPRVIIVNQAFADQFFPGQNPVGSRIISEGPPQEIVGVAGNVRQKGLRIVDTPAMYIPCAQFSWPEMLLTLRSALPPSTLAGAAVRAVHDVDADVPVYDVASMEERIAGSLAAERSNMLLMGLFAGLALTLATIGIFGVIAYFVSRRSHEIGIRMALGARPGDVLRLVLGHGMSLALVGIALGLAGALAATRALRTFLYGVTAGDPITFAGASLLFAVVAGVACYLPARRATQTDPMITLRHE